MSKSMDDLYWDYYHAGRAQATAQGYTVLGYIRSRMQKDIPNIVDDYFDGSPKKFMLWTEEKFINK